MQITTSSTTYWIANGCLNLENSALILLVGIQQGGG